MLKIRLRRMGKTHAPFYRVVVSDSRRTPTASAVEEVGHYNPRPTPPEVKIDLSRVRYWVDQGALLSPTVKKLVQKAEAAPAPAAAETTATEKAPKAARKAAPAAEQAPAPEASTETAPEEAPAAEAAPEAETDESATSA